MNHKEAFDLFVIYYYKGVHHYADGEFDNINFSLNLKKPFKGKLIVGKSFFTDMYRSIKKGTNKNFIENQCNAIKDLYQKAVEYGKVDHEDADGEENSKDIAAFQSYYNHIPHILSEIGIESDTDSEKGIGVLDRAPEIIGTILDNLNKKKELELYEIYHLIKVYYPDIELTDSASEILYANENKFSKEILSFPINHISETEIKTDYFKKRNQALFSSNNAVIIQGPIGTGKFTIAIEYARKNQKYDKIVCLKWDVDFDHTIAHISTSDDCFNEKESENDRINRKNEIWKNNAGTTILMIICDVPSKSVENLLKKHASGNHHIICTISEPVGPDIQFKIIRTEQPSDEVFDSITAKKIPSLDPIANSQEFQKLRLASDGNLLVHNLLLEFMVQSKNISSFIIGKIYSNFCKKPYLDPVELNFKYRFIYHGEEKEMSFEEYILNIFGISRLKPVSMNLIHKIADFMQIGTSYVYFDDMLKALNMYNEEAISEFEKMQFIIRTENGVSIKPYIKHILLDNSNVTSYNTINHTYQMMNRRNLTEKDFYFLGIVGIETIKAIKCRVGDPDSCLVFFQQLYVYAKTLNHIAAEILLIPLTGIEKCKYVYIPTKIACNVGLKIRWTILVELNKQLLSLYYGKDTAIPEDLIEGHIGKIKTIQYSLDYILNKYSVQKDICYEDISDEQCFFACLYSILTSSIREFIFHRNKNYDDFKNCWEPYYKNEINGNQTEGLNIIPVIVYTVILFLRNSPDPMNIQHICDLFSEHFEALCSEDDSLISNGPLISRFIAIEAYCGNPLNIEVITKLVKNGMPLNDINLILSCAMIGQSKDIIRKISELQRDLLSADTKRAQHCNFQYFADFDEFDYQNAVIEKQQKKLADIKNTCIYLNLNPKAIQAINDTISSFNKPNGKCSDPDINTLLPSYDLDDNGNKSIKA